jgi:hypothetical protein
MKLFGIDDEKDTPILFTRWSIVHLLTGMFLMILFLYGVTVNDWSTNHLLIKGLLVVTVIHAMYEVKDLIQSRTKNPKYTVSLLNSIGDQISATIGALLIYPFVSGTCETALIASLTMLATSNVFWMA